MLAKNQMVKRLIPMEKKLISIIKNTTELSLNTEKILVQTLQNHNFKVKTEFDPKAELLITIGGDGSFLRTMHNYDFPQMPVIGINTGHLGFFQELLPRNIEDFVDKYEKKEYIVNEIKHIEAEICTNSACMQVIGINEIVIKGDKSATIHLRITLDNDELEKFSGDGILVATTAGSTAYNYSLGGSIVHPNINILQITPISPINTTAYRSFTSSVILPESTIIGFVPEYTYENSILVVTDGMEYNYKGIESIVIRYSEIGTKLLRMNNYNFWYKAKNKFL